MFAPIIDFFIIFKFYFWYNYFGCQKNKYCEGFFWKVSCGPKNVSKSESWPQKNHAKCVVPHLSMSHPAWHFIYERSLIVRGSYQISDWSVTKFVPKRFFRKCALHYLTNHLRNSFHPQSCGKLPIFPGESPSQIVNNISKICDESYITGKLICY